MSKVTGPLFSLSAWKTLKKTLCFQRRPSGHAVYLKTTPYKTKTSEQEAMRVYMGEARAYWRQLPTEYQRDWNDFVIG